MVTESRLLGGRYEIGPLLGHGGMAEVHLARDTRLGREVAVKTLRSDLARDPAFLTRFRREAQSAAGLNHPSIVAVYDTGEEVEPTGTVPYIVMEYVEGRTLRDLVGEQRRLPWRQALEITARVCAALDHSHRQGIVHRDVKPANVMITPTGDVKVMDFGIARALTATSATMTQTAAVLGTAQYLSPEQARGEPVDARSDVYSTGCLLYELLTGSPPFTGDSAVAVAYQHVREMPVAPSRLATDLPPQVDAIVLKAMAKNPVNRYQSAADMRVDCERAAGGGPVAAPLPLHETATAAYLPVPPASTLVRSEPPPDSHGGAYALLALLALALLVGGFFLFRSLSGGGTSKVAVPDLRGDTQAAADAELKAAGLRLDGITRVKSLAAAGTVIRQDPAAATSLAKGGSVDITLSAGVTKVTVPDVTNLKQDAAREALISRKLTPGNVTPEPSSAPAGTVIGQDPAAGSSVTEGATVNLTVASGVAKVPDIVGKDADTARTLLYRAGFTVATTTAPSTSAKAGTVIDQSPNGGASLDAGGQVTITVAVAAAPSPTPTTSSPSPPSPPSPTPPPSLSPTLSPTPTGSPTPTLTSATATPTP